MMRQSGLLIWPVLLAAGLSAAEFRGADDAPTGTGENLKSRQPFSDMKFPDVADLPSHRKLPEALTMFDGTPVTTRDDWYHKRRPELKALFQQYVYGYMPPPPGITARVTKVALGVCGGKAKLKEIEISIHGLAGNPVPRIHLALFVPARTAGAVPVFLALNACGNQEVVSDPAVTHDRSARVDKPCGGRGCRADFWCVENTIDRGYAFATFHQSDVCPDETDIRGGIPAHYPALATPETRWGTLAAWAWGLMRAVDYLVTDAEIDPGRIAVIGHSRRGKAALLAGAFDERIWLVVPHQSGTGGCALCRDNDQESVAKINRAFPHWFDQTFRRFGGHEDRLPVDQHLLMALVAPRLLLDTAGTQDHWSNYESALRGLREADKVYRFLGARGLVGRGVIEGSEKITAANCGDLLQYRRAAPHTLNKDYWDAILDFAQAHAARRAADRRGKP